MSDRPAIGAVAGQAVVDVAHRHQPHHERDLLAAQTVGIAGPVEALVVPADQPDRVANRRQRLDDVRPLDGVLLDDPVLLGRQSGRLVQDGVGDADLADVV
ncbi:MAG: hypothetical protein U0736_14385 [Gemmataceae bacterium]